jgi:N-acetylglutamate synthase-like GNAT family acetyltransferase
MEMAKSLPDGTPLPELEKMLISAFTARGGNSKVFVEGKDENIRGFIFGSIEWFDGQDSCFVQACVVDPKEKNVCFELLARMKEWAKEKNVEYIYFMTPRDYKAYIRKYKFDYYSTVLRKKVKEE